MIKITDRIVEYPDRYKLSKVAGTADIYDLKPAPGAVTEEGTAVNKALLDEMLAFSGKTVGTATAFSVHQPGLAAILNGNCGRVQFHLAPSFGATLTVSGNRGFSITAPLSATLIGVNEWVTVVYNGNLARWDVSKVDETPRNYVFLRQAEIVTPINEMVIDMSDIDLAQYKQLTIYPDLILQKGSSGLPAFYLNSKTIEPYTNDIQNSNTLGWRRINIPCKQLLDPNSNNYTLLCYSKMELFANDIGNEIYFSQTSFEASFLCADSTLQATYARHYEGGWNSSDLRFNGITSIIFFSATKIDHGKIMIYGVKR